MLPLRQFFPEPPTRADLAVLLGAPRADELGFTLGGDTFDIVIAARSIWRVMPALMWFGLVTVVTPWMAPLWGAVFMGWTRYLTLLLLVWGLVLPALLVACGWLMNRDQVGESVLMVDPVAGKLWLPQQGRVVTFDRLVQVVELIRWALDRRHWKPVVQTSLVVRHEDPPGYEVLPIVTQVRPSRLAMPLADRLGEMFHKPVVRVRLDSVKSRDF